ncbi:MAG: N-acetyltransferase [Alphaproteobacteria bacterium CG_4_9_14_3_um_filter_47_13]|nr:MAG: N-acetyltransferase [Alphaproteobacteria bacterium CG_4_9_14_3_um_filter_47_13]
MSTEPIEIRHLQPDDYSQWLFLWDGNNQGHKNSDVTAETWNRLMLPIFPVHGLGAFREGKMAGLLHYILHPVTGHIDPVCYMQDVYVDPSYRRQGTARALVAALSNIGAKEGWARIYWLAENDNIPAQNLYKNTGVKLDFSLHILPISHF